MKQSLCLTLIFLAALPVAGQDRPAAMIDRDDHQAERQEWFYQQRKFPLTQIPAGARIRAVEAVKRLDRLKPAAKSAAKSATTDSSNWKLIGPQPTDQGTTYSTAGRVNSIAIDPRDSNTVYIGAAEGGVWKTTNGGTAWTPLTDDQSSLANGAIVLDPKDPDKVFVGTGEENFNSDSYYGAGILKSPDGGRSWTNEVGPFLRAKIGSISIHPANSQVLLCTTELGVWRSTDGAVNWTRVLGTVAGTSVIFDPTDGNIAYAAIGSVGGNALNGVYRSSDAGVTWSRLTGTGLNALPTRNVGRITIALAPSTPTTLYVAIANALTAGSSNGVILGVWKTTDSGGTWNQLSSVPASFCAAQCWYDMALAVHPRNPDIVFGGGFAVLRTLDGGASWRTLPRIGPNTLEIHVDQHALVFTTDGSKLYIGNDGGVYSTTDIERATVNWTPLNDSLAITQFYPGLSAHPSNPDILVGGAQDNGTQLYSGNLSWSNVTCGDGGYTLIDSAVPTIFYAACQNIAIRKTGDGVAFLPSAYGIDQGDRAQFIAPLAMDPTNPRTLYFGTYRVWQSLDGGGRWRAISGDLTGGTATIKTIAVAPGDGSVLYVGANDGTLQVTRNGSTWTDRSAGLPIRTITHITVDPVDPMTAYVTFSGFPASTAIPGHIFKTNDGGASWKDNSGNMPNVPVNDLVIDPDIPGTLYAGTDAGVLVSTDDGASWTTQGYGLPRVVVSSLVLQRSSRVLRAATHGRSVWEIAVPLTSPSQQPVIQSLSPAQANAGGANITLAVTGTNFRIGSAVLWNGRSLPTVVADSAHVSAQITASDLSRLGRATVAVFNPVPGGGASNTVNFSIGPAPVSKPEAFVSAANPTGGNALAPRSIASLFGVNLAPEQAVADLAPPLPLTLADLSLNLDGNQLPLFFVSPGQVNFQVPFVAVTRPTQFPLVITQGTLSTTIQVTLKPFAPALFTTNAQGTGQGSVLIAGTASVAAPVGTLPGSRPAKRGDFISIYCTGLGDVRNRPGLGSASPGVALASTLVDPAVLIGGVSAMVSFSGLAPGFVGLYQVNVQVPDAVSSGAALPIVLTIGGETSNTATIAVE